MASEPVENLPAVMPTIRQGIIIRVRKGQRATLLTHPAPDMAGYCGTIHWQSSFLIHADGNLPDWPLCL